jgi:hypothetical protein
MHQVVASATVLGQSGTERSRSTGNDTARCFLRKQATNLDELISQRHQNVVEAD